MTEADEPVDRVDARDRFLAVVGRGEAVREGWLHRVSVTVCRDREGRFLVHRRSERAARYPGHHEVGFGGAVAAGETYREAAARELVEELGVRPVVRPVVTFLNRTGLSPHWLAVHEAVLSERPRPSGEEVAWHGWSTKDELLCFLGAGLFTPDSPEVLRRYLAAANRERGQIT
ncbi:NUDIX domain-containing protein [Streptomyces sp. HSG2]|uniref:NUDIX domain-containing protein n=1 Tax=Streptomyces sp. HSG2 TaxID=2797167 RepID=UPI0019055916|nr:NUDIX domain-containing protein [Streptomyces sp. HSG2]